MKSPKSIEIHGPRSQNDGFGGQSFGAKSSKSWFGTRIVKTRPSCMVGVVEHQKTCFLCLQWSNMYLLSV